MISTMEIEADLRRDEGVETHAYRCSEDKLTIGVGRNIDPRGGLGLSDTEISFLLQNDIKRVLLELHRNFPWWSEMPDPWQRALANMCFQLGVSRLRDFKLMLMALEAGDGEQAAHEALDSRWAQQTPERAERIAALYRS